MDESYVQSFLVVDPDGDPNTYAHEAVLYSLRDIFDLAVRVQGLYDL